MSKKQERGSEKQVDAQYQFGLLCEQFADWMHSVFTGEVHVSQAKEEMVRLWQEVPEDVKRDFAKLGMESFDRAALSLESLRQEFTVATVRHRQ